MKHKMVQGADNPELAGVFSEMLSQDGSNVKITIPKYIKIYTLLEKFIKVIGLSASCGLLTYDTDIVADFTEQLAKFGKHNEYAALPELITESKKKAFMKDYIAIKESDLVFHAYVTCDHLTEFAEPIKAGSTSFATNEAGIGLKLFSFADFDFKLLYSRWDEREASIMTKILSKLLDIGREIYDLITCPDIDMDEFAGIISNAIKEIKRIPKFSRCLKALSKLEESFGMFKSNFGSYYRDFVATKKSSIIMENFILDVAKDPTDLETIGQFKVIIEHFRSQGKLANTDPRISKILEEMNSKFDSLDQNAPNLSKKKQK